MKGNAVTRRNFIAASVGAGALSAVGIGTSYNVLHQAKADETMTQISSGSVYTLCDSCPQQCGFKAHIKDGVISKYIADPYHPSAQGSLCARGYANACELRSAERITTPLRKNDDGAFVPITWDDAFGEIGEKLLALIGEEDPMSLACISNTNSTAEFYLRRFMYALHCPNVYVLDLTCNPSRLGGFSQVIGYDNYKADVENSDVILYLGAHVSHATQPSTLKSLQVAYERGAHTIVADSRCGNACAFAQEWLPLTPGSELAFLLSLCNVLIRNELYDKSYIDKWVTGFDEFYTSIAQYTPQWAQTLCGISSFDIERIAVLLAEHAPHVVITTELNTTFGCGYANSGETARMVCILNTLLSNWNVKGGALLLPSFDYGELDEALFKPMSLPVDLKWGFSEYPLAYSEVGAGSYAATLALEGKLHGLFIYHTDFVSYGNPTYMSKCLKELDLCVVIDSYMTDTALSAHYVLPEASFLYRMDLPVFNRAPIPSVSLRSPVLKKQDSTALSVDEIISGIAVACGYGELFNFSLEELADAQLKSVGTSLSELKKIGTLSFSDLAFTRDSYLHFSTDDGKIHFASEACRKAGLSGSPTWVTPLFVPSGDYEFRLVGGYGESLTPPQSESIDPVLNLAEDYQLNHVWINAQQALDLGLADGDEIELSNEWHTARVLVKPTQRIAPSVLYVPFDGILGTESLMHDGDSFRTSDFLSYECEPAYGSVLKHEIVVTLKKVSS